MKTDLLSARESLLIVQVELENDSFTRFVLT
jgi:hypothetical protein